MKMATLQEQLSNLCLKVTPDLLLDQGQSAEMSVEEEQVMRTIYSILRQGYAILMFLLLLCYSLIVRLK